MFGNDADGLTRRRVLGGIGVAGGVAVAGGAGAVALHDAALPTARSPEPGTWPQSGYGPRNTAWNPNARPPAGPDHRSVDAPGDPGDVVVGLADGDRRVLVGGLDGVAAYDADGTRLWSGPPGDTVAVRPGTGECFAGPAGGTPLRSHSLADGSRRWDASWDDWPAYALVPVSGGLFVGFNGGVALYDDHGNRRYSVHSDRGTGDGSVAVGNGVFVSLTGLVGRLAPRGLVRDLRGQRPDTRWRRTPDVLWTPHIGVDGGELYVTDERKDDDGGVLSMSTDGRIRWHRRLGHTPQALAVGDERVFVAVDVSEDGSRLYALDRGDGATRWRRDRRYVALAGAGETLLAGGDAPDDRGRIDAYRPDGERLWSLPVPDTVRDLAPVGDRVYAVGTDGRLHVLE